MIVRKLRIDLLVGKIRRNCQVQWPKGNALTGAFGSILFVAAMIFGFASNWESLLCNYDGAYFEVVSRLQHQWAPAIPSASCNPFAGVGDVFFNFHTQFSPAFGIAEICGGATLNLTTLYLVTALELSLAIIFFGNCMHLPRSITWFAAWVSPLMSLPLLYFNGPLLYRVSALTPHRFELMAAALVVLGIYRRIGTGSRRGDLAQAAAIFVLVTWLSVCGAATFVLVAPTILIVGLFLLAGSENRTELRRKAWYAAGLVAVAAPTIIPYFLGNYFYSAPAFFMSEMITDRFVPHNLFWVSSLFHDKTTGRAGPWFIVAAIIGAALAIRKGPRPMKVIGAISVGSLVAVVGGGLAIMTWWTTYLGPKPLYFEIGFWPFYTICCGYLIRCAALSALAVVRRIARTGPDSQTLGSAGTGPGNMVETIACLSIAVVCSLLVFSNPAQRTQREPMLIPPLHELTPVVDYLRDHTELTVGGPFRGMTATFTGYHDHPEGVEWPDQVNNDMNFVRASGNDLRGMGLWYHHIPTLFEYNQLYSPSYYLMLTRLLTRPQDRQGRNLVLISKPQPDYLQSVGVRFVISDYELPSPFEATLEQTSTQLSSKIWLYELPRPNLGNYSPTEFIVNFDLLAAAEVLRQPGFDFQKQAVVSESLPGEFVPAATSEVRFGKGVASVAASSAGRSVLLLPLQFSHCLDLKVRQAEGSQEPPKLIRMNVMQAGLVFSGKIDVDIRYLNGPFHNPWERLHDYFDFRDHCGK